MGKRGPAPRANISTKWSSNLAYVVGLLASDGCLIEKGHYVDLTSKDIEQVENFKRCLGLQVKIGVKRSGFNGSNAYRVQFKNVLFYNFLVSVGLTPNKSKTLGEIKVPKEYFFDFLRGSFDGDGCTYSYWDTRWKTSFMFYLTFVSASRAHIDWLRANIQAHTGAHGHISFDGKKKTNQLKYAKRESLTVFRKMYNKEGVVCLTRKKLKIGETLRIVGEQL